MKTVRILLLVLLAMLLPLRGALAAVHCGQQEGPGTELALQSHEHEALHDGLAASGHGHAEMHSVTAADATSGAQAGDDTTPVDRAAPDHCGMGAASCSSAPLVSAIPCVSLPADGVGAHFPSHHARAASFLCSGPERPPRTV